MHDYDPSQMKSLAGALLRERESTATDPVSQVFAVTSCQRAEGVTTVCNLLSRELADSPHFQVLMITTTELGNLTAHDLAAPETRWTKNPVEGFWQMAPLVATPATGAAVWQKDPYFAKDLIQTLRTQFGLVIVDCRPLLASDDVPRLAHLVDGVIMVVQADRSTNQQLRHALQLLALTGAAFKGFVLNRRTYPIPDRIYRWLRS
jgi:Mrp family chromosome partitioning ATPase